jgi:hypothetical protein
MTYGGMKIQIHVFLTSALYGCKWSVSHPGPFIPEGKSLPAYWIGDSSAPEPVQTRWWKEECLLPPGIEIVFSGSPAHSLVTYWLSQSNWRKEREKQHENIRDKNIDINKNGKSLQYIVSHVAWYRLPTSYIPQLSCSTAPVLPGWRLSHD